MQNIPTTDAALSCTDTEVLPLSSAFQNQILPDQNGIGYFLPTPCLSQP